MRIFTLERMVDVSGVSGTGTVAQGVEFSDGTVVLRWVTGEHHSTVVWDSIESVEIIHGHDGRTAVAWADGTDDEAPERPSGAPSSPSGATGDQSPAPAPREARNAPTDPDAPTEDVTRYCENEVCAVILFRTDDYSGVTDENCPGCGQYGRKKGQQ